MKKLRVYLDTSVVGGCFDQEFAVWSNALVVDFGAGRLLPVVSELVAAKVQVAPPQVQEKLDELLTLGAELLRIDRNALGLAAEYTRHGILPARFRNDLLHIATGRESGCTGELELQEHSPAREDSAVLSGQPRGRL